MYCTAIITQKMLVCNSSEKKYKVFLDGQGRAQGMRSASAQFFQKTYQNFIDKICKTYYNNVIILEGVASACAASQHHGPIQNGLACLNLRDSLYIFPYKELEKKDISLPSTENVLGIFCYKVY